MTPSRIILEEPVLQGYIENHLFCHPELDSGSALGRDVPKFVQYRNVSSRSVNLEYPNLYVDGTIQIFFANAN